MDTYSSRGKNTDASLVTVTSQLCAKLRKFSAFQSNYITLWVLYLHLKLLHLYLYILVHLDLLCLSFIMTPLVNYITISMCCEAVKIKMFFFKFNFIKQWKGFKKIVLIIYLKPLGTKLCKEIIDYIGLIAKILDFF